MSLITQAIRLVRADSRAVCGSDADIFRSLAVIQDELDLCCTIGKTDPARTFIKRRLHYVVRAFNVDRVIPV